MALSRFHVTVLSNFACGFDKYSDSYNKNAIPESTYPDRFYVMADIPDRDEETQAVVANAIRPCKTN